MKAGTKATLISVTVLTGITLVCVALLAISNVLLKYEPKLDSAMAARLYELCPTGEADATNALEFFELISGNECVDKVNGEFRRKNAAIVALYRAVKGANEGRYIVQAKSKGRDGDVVMLTSYNADGSIMHTVCYSQSESYWAAHIAKEGVDGFETLPGMSGQIEADDIAVSTGATRSLEAVARAVTISNRLAEELIAAELTEETNDD